MSRIDTFRSACESFVQDAFTINYTLAKNPEISGCEFESVKTIGAVLEKHGIPVTYEFCDLPTAFKASAVKVENPQGGRLAILCEYDALPEVGGHACGHCASGSMSVLAALALHKMQEDGAAFTMDIDIIGTLTRRRRGGARSICAMPACSRNMIWRLWCISTERKHGQTRSFSPSTASVLSSTASRPMRQRSLERR